MRTPLAIVAVLIGCASPLIGCGGDDAGSAPVGGDPRPAEDGSRGARAAEARRLPPVLAKLRSQEGQLLDGGADAFEARLDELEGHPVVVNKWASWCAPCRAEFPFFAAQADKRAGEVAFMGVNSSDSDAQAATFLEEYPVPYPSYKDPDLKVAEVFNGVAAFPTTAFYDDNGELAYLKQGGYASEELLAEDIERYAR